MAVEYITGKCASICLDVCVDFQRHEAWSQVYVHVRILTVFMTEEWNRLVACLNLWQKEKKPKTVLLFSPAVMGTEHHPHTGKVKKCHVQNSAENSLPGALLLSHWVAQCL